MKNRICNLNRKQLILLLLNGMFIIAFLLLSLFGKRTVEKLYSQQEAERWESEKNSYAQVSAFISPQRDMQTEDISDIRSAITGTLAEDSLYEVKENARVWIDAYSGECQAELRKDNNILSVKAVGVGGDFFQFHPQELLSGSYISESDLNNDRIVVDEGFAWAMFGSNNIVGMQVWMDNRIYVIAGVVSVEEDTLNQTAYGDSNRIYMFYEQLKKHQEDLKITCYEAVMPDPISNYACNTLQKACGLESSQESSVSGGENPLNFQDIEVVENSNRYDMIPLLSKVKILKFRSMRTNSVPYPYWENVARVVEEQQIIYLIVKLVVLVIPCICLLCLLYHLWERRTWRAKDIAIRIVAKIEEMREVEEEEI